MFHAATLTTGHGRDMPAITVPWGRILRLGSSRITSMRLARYVITTSPGISPPTDWSLSAASVSSGWNGSKARTTSRIAPLQTFERYEKPTPERFASFKRSQLMDNKPLPVARRLTINQSIRTIERRLTTDLSPRERERELDRLATLRRMLGGKR